MPELSDEILMSFVDGMLAPEEQARVAMLVRDNRELARRVRAFERTGAALSALYEPMAKEPVPQYLIETIRKGARAPAPVKAKAGLLEQVKDFVREAVEGASFRNPQSYAYAMAGVAALAAGWAGYTQFIYPQFMGPSAHERAVIANLKGKRVAIGELARLLESKPSLFPSKFIEAEGAAVALLSFKSRDGTYCRQYEMQLPERKPVSGIACRDAKGRWTLDKQAVVARARNLENVGVPGNPGKMVVSGQQEPEAQGDDGEGASSVEARIDELIAGPALGSVDEGRMLKKQWSDE